MFETCRSSAAIRLRLFTIDAEILGSALRSRILARSHSRQRAFTFFRQIADPLARDTARCARLSGGLSMRAAGTVSPVERMARSLTSTSILSGPDGIPA